VQYLAAWLRGTGCVPLYNLMEDAATAEISRAQLWQWVHNPNGILEDGRKITIELVREIAKQELATIKTEVGATQFNSGKYLEAALMFDQFTANTELAEFLTLAAYETYE
jgi:malate synthase